MPPKSRCGRAQCSCRRSVRSRVVLHFTNQSAAAGMTLRDVKASNPDGPATTAHDAVRTSLFEVRDCARPFLSEPSGRESHRLNPDSGGRCDPTGGYHYEVSTAVVTAVRYHGWISSSVSSRTVRTVASPFVTVLATGHQKTHHERDRPSSPLHKPDTSAPAITSPPWVSIPGTFITATLMRTP